MAYNSFTKKLVFLIVCCLAAMFNLVGCQSPAEYKTDADEQAYNIIDQKWQDDFGSKANFKISDTEPSPNDIKIEKAVPASGILTLPQAVAMATAHNRQYQLEKEILYVRALDLRLARHEFEPSLFSGGREAYGKAGSNEGIGGEADIGFQKLLAGGTRIGTKVGIAWFKVITGDIRGGLASILSVAISQPLLRGSNKEVVMENLTQAERDTLYQIRLFNRFRKTFVVSIITQYYRVLQLYDTAEYARTNYEALFDVHLRVEKLTAAGRLPLLELDRVRQEKLQARDIYIQTLKEYKQGLDEFKITLSLPTNAELRLDANELETIKTVEMSYPDFSETDAVDTAASHRLDLANSADAIADAERKIVVAADGLRGELNLFAGVDATSLTGTSELPGVGALDDDFTADRGRLNPLRRMRDNNPLRDFRDEAEIGIDWELPLDRVAEQNLYRKALIALTQRQREYEQAHDVVILEVRGAYRDLTAAAEQYKVQTEALELARKRFENTSLLLKYGRASSRRVLNAQNDLFDAQTAATQTLVSYTVATLNFYRDAGVLQVHPDGMWEY